VDTGNVFAKIFLMVNSNYLCCRFNLKVNKMSKDWTGNSNSVYKTLGASNHTDKDREELDFYATDPIAAELLLREETFSERIWECSCGQGHLSKVFERNGYEVRSTDLVDRGYGEGGVDFLGLHNLEWEGDIITNPPYKYSSEFIYKALSIIPEGRKVAMFLKLQFMEGKGRKRLFMEFPPRIVYVSSSRIMCAKNGDFESKKKEGSAVAYAWYVWEKGYKGETVIKWIN